MEEENPIISMARTRKIIRRSIHTFLKHYQYFTSIATLIALPFSISLLISQSLVVPRSFSLLHSIYARLDSVFDAAGFPPFFSLLCLKLSQTITTSILTFPFAISFLLVAKASIIHFLKTHFQKYPSYNNSENDKSSFLGVYTPLLSTQLWNSFLIFSANATSISTLFFAFTFLESGTHFASPKWALLLSAIGAVFYSIVLANALVISNLALVSSGMEGSRRGGGFTEILRACALIKGKTSIALALAVPINLGLAAIEALFHFRIVTSITSFHDERKLWVLALEGLLIGYLYSILIVLDVIMSCFFYRSCHKSIKSRFSSQEIDRDDRKGVDEDGYYYYDNVEKLKGLEEFV